ncbi:MAG: hypothetical protein IJ982_00285, partial [Fibrobacter sp.]|nr:hypothetical protein [Fibrobacter sp.]
MKERKRVVVVCPNDPPTEYVIIRSLRAPARTIPAINKSVFIVISGESRSIRRTSRRRLARRSFGRSGP